MCAERACLRCAALRRAEEAQGKEAADADAEAEVAHQRVADANRRADTADRNYAKLRSVCVGARQVCTTARPFPPTFPHRTDETLCASSFLVSFWTRVACLTCLLRGSLLLGSYILFTSELAVSCLYKEVVQAHGCMVSSRRVSPHAAVLRLPHARHSALRHIVRPSNAVTALRNH